MTPKEKAKELWSDFLGCLIRTSNTYIDNGFIEEQAKQCALIAVQEIINFGNKAGIREPMMYWNKVEQEIKKL
jgi:hypothetical protein